MQLHLVDCESYIAFKQSPMHRKQSVTIDLYAISSYIVHAWNQYTTITITNTSMENNEKQIYVITNSI